MGSPLIQSVKQATRTTEPTQEPVVRLKIPAMHLPEAY